MNEAQARLVEPAPLWLALAIESIRYHMPKSTVDGYAKLWEAEQKKKCRSETAGELAELMGAFFAAGIEYPGRDKHVKQVLAYLRRTLRSEIPPRRHRARRRVPQARSRRVLRYSRSWSRPD